MYVNTCIHMYVFYLHMHLCMYHTYVMSQVICPKILVSSLNQWFEYCMKKHGHNINSIHWFNLAILICKVCKITKLKLPPNNLHSYMICSYSICLWIYSYLVANAYIATLTVITGYRKFSWMMHEFFNLKYVILIVCKFICSPYLTT